jgi:membrane protein YdbS with pleckstrin-like domain
MPYPKRLLSEGETITLDLRPHWWYFSRHILSGIPLLLLFALAVHFGNGYLWWFWGIVALIWAGWLALQYFNWTFTHFVVTSKRVVFRTGVLAKHGVEIPLDRISNINFNQTIWERIIGAGDLEIESAGRDGQTKFDNVVHPDAVQHELYGQIEERARSLAGYGTGAPPPAAAPAPGASVPEQLDQLAALRDRGVITAAEFEAKKAQLLDRM